ncbi:MAG: glycosyltransferase, partial [Bacteroides sp.]
MNEVPQISFITICYNGLEDTCELIESLHRTIHSVSYEIIVVDNASRQDEAAVIARRYPQVKTVRSDRNLGFSGGNNLGMQHATGCYL